MSTDRPGASEVRIVARAPLLRTGLASLAAQVGAETTDAAGAALTLRGPDTAATDADVELVVDGTTVVVTVRRVPDPATWATAFRLLEVLLAPQPADARRESSTGGVASPDRR